MIDPVTRFSEPFAKFAGVGEHSAALASRDPMHGEAALLLPTANGALVAVEEGRNLLPRIQSLVGNMVRGTVAHPKYPLILVGVRYGEGVPSHYTRNLCSQTVPFFGLFLGL